MNLISPSQRAIYNAAMDNIHQTFARPITIINFVKTAKTAAADINDSFDFTQSQNNDLIEFDHSSVEKTVLSRIKYIDKQEIDSELVQNELSNLSVQGGLIRIKVKKEDSETVKNADNIVVDGLNTIIKYIDTRHGLFDIDYSTFYLQRTP